MQSYLNTIKEQLKQGARAMKSARALYDGDNTTDNVVRKQMLPKYLQDVVNFSRRSDLGKNDVIALQKLVRKARRVVLTAWHRMGLLTGRLRHPIRNYWTR